MNRPKLWALPVLLGGIALGAGAIACGENIKDNSEEGRGQKLLPDSARIEQLRRDSIEAVRADSLTRYESLTEEDFRLVADELDVEVAAIKAVVKVETGGKMKGFSAPGVPVVNFDASMYKKYGSKAQSKAGDKNAAVPPGLKGHALREWTQLTNARQKNAQGADMGTFWGMFQIGGFHYKTCGCATVDEFVAKMSYSELEQLELFARFIESKDLVKYLRDHDWAKFSRIYNGPSYARRGYHTKMAKAYKEYSS